MSDIAKEVVDVDRAAPDPRQEFRLVAKMTPTLVWRAELKGNIEYVSERPAEYVGASLGEVIGLGGIKGTHHDNATCGKSVFRTHGEFRGYRGTSTDVTATVPPQRAEASLRRAQAELAHLSRVTTLGLPAASIAHEVTQPLATARNNARAAQNFLESSGNIKRDYKVFEA